MDRSIAFVFRCTGAVISYKFRNIWNVCPDEVRAKLRQMAASKLCAVILIVSNKVKIYDQLKTQWSPRRPVVEGIFCSANSANHRRTCWGDAASFCAGKIWRFYIVPVRKWNGALQRMRNTIWAAHIAFVRLFLEMKSKRPFYSVKAALAR